ncbi:RNA polymerase sigma factor [Larkinella sp. VNQ87]|uniref:RNA polymerase sigma factor n=1 Tax=Larkinella sp. VNQ87 TaxID=3400921 RepID=UPI003C05D2A5
MATSEDTQLWLAFQQGDEEAYTRLYRTHIRSLYRYGMSLVPASKAFVLNCIHDVFTEIWVKRDRLTQPNNVRYYLLKVLKVRNSSVLDICTTEWYSVGLMASLTDTC